MALPTAQLGQLPSMNMPYSIPTVEKGPKIWERALAQFLVNAAGGLATQGAENVMSRDYASEFGEDPATGWGRLTQGPKVGAEAAEQRRQLAAQQKAAEDNRMFQAALAGYEDEGRRMEQNSANFNREVAGLQDSTNRYNQMTGTLAGNRAELGMKQGAEAELLQLKAFLDQSSPETKAQIENLLASAAANRAQEGKMKSEAAYSDLIVEDLRRQQGMKTKGATLSAPTEVDPAAEALRVQQTPITPKQQALQDFLGSYEGAVKYPETIGLPTAQPSFDPITEALMTLFKKAATPANAMSSRSPVP